MHYSGAMDSIFEAYHIDSGWAHALEPVKDTISAMLALLADEEAAGYTVLPAKENIFRAFTYPFEQVKVLIVGQDPYPNPGHAIGLSFATERDVSPLPASLRNIYREYKEDTGLTPPRHGDLTAWCEHGVMLLNRVLTVRAGVAGSHAGKGWEAVTDCAIRALAERDTPLVAILWGKQATQLARLLGETPIISSPHPSPLSAYRGFFGSRPFTRANELLVDQGAEIVDWSLPA